MPSLLLACLENAAALALGVLALRAFPMLLAWFTRPEPAYALKLAALTIYLVAMCAAMRWAQFDTGALLIAYVYLGAVSVVPYKLSMRCSRAALFALLLLLFLLLPALYWKERSLLLLLGWELTLSAYSYLIDAPASSRNVFQYCSFLFVQPTLAYPCRGAQVSPGVCLRGLGRAVAGLSALGLSGALTVLGREETTPWLIEHGVSIGAGLLRVSSVYAAHWGLASLQIGLARQLGYVVPERYLQPYRSRSPRDFWTRWNTYLGAWIRLYVFQPLTRRLGLLLASALPRTSARGRRLASRAIAVTASFVIVGALHDVYTGLLTRRPNCAATLWFAANGLLLVIWEGAAFALRRPQRSASWARALVLAGCATLLAAVLP